MGTDESSTANVAIKKRLAKSKLSKCVVSVFRCMESMVFAENFQLPYVTFLDSGALHNFGGEIETDL